MRSIRKLEPLAPPVPTRKRVGAYARVSSGKDAMLHSLSAQISYYSDYIQKHRGWEYVGVYVDEALTGTKDSRTGFQRMLKDCRDGKIDMVITKSISRFARNTVTMLEAVRELKMLGVDVYFEKENIHSLSGDGELMLTILASFAQEESRSVSENCKWRIRNKFKDGLAYSFSMLGYDLENGTLKIIPKEAETVRAIFADYLSGMGKVAIMKKLNTAGVTTKQGYAWNKGAVDRILRNEKYVGDMLLQKKYRSNHIDKETRVNRGELPMYYVKDGHEPIIDRDTFNRVQEEINRRAAQHHPYTVPPKTYPFTSMIVCEKCGKHYRRKINNAGSKYSRAIWICSTFNQLGKAACDNKQIPEDILLSLTAEVLGLAEFDETVFKKRVAVMKVPEPNSVVYVFHDGREVKAFWQDKSRQDSWTDAAKQQAREKALQRRFGK